MRSVRNDDDRRSPQFEHRQRVLEAATNSWAVNEVKSFKRRGD
jgi:hypothetical protein